MTSRRNVRFYVETPQGSLLKLVVLPILDPKSARFPYRNFALPHCAGWGSEIGGDYISSKTKGPGEEGAPGKFRLRNWPISSADFPMTPMEGTDHFGPFWERRLLGQSPAGPSSPGSSALLLAWPPLQSLAVKKNIFLRKFWAVINF